jgi:hypothetical protein
MDARVLRGIDPAIKTKNSTKNTLLHLTGRR